MSRPVLTLPEEDTLVSDDQLESILGDVLELYGYDFTDYSRASFRRRVSRLFNNDRFLTFDQFRNYLRNNPSYFTRFLEQITVTVTEMFRDVTFYKMLREEIFPSMTALPRIRIWHAGCATGEEVFSTAILLHEANLLHKSLLYATDINATALERVRSGIFPLDNANQYAVNYALSGGKADFSSYYDVYGPDAGFKELLTRNTVVDTNNLVSDCYFDDFNLILCRNVLIYFDKPLQDRILKLFHRSLAPAGLLALGSKETLNFSAVERKFFQPGVEKIWRKK